MIAVIGGGISGLSVALELQKWCEPCIVFEKNSYTGGVIRSEHSEGYLYEYGPNTILADQEIRKYITDLHLDSEIIRPEKVSRSRFIYRGGRYHKLPSGPFSLAASGLLSLNSKLTIIKELWNRSSPQPDETLGDFITRRFDREIEEYVLAPFVNGIYAGDMDQLLLSETLPVLHQYESEYGSVLKGFIRNNSRERRESLYFKGGMQTLTDAMARQVKRLRLNSTVESVTKTADGYQLRVNSEGKAEMHTCHAIVFATPPSHMESLLRPLYPGLSSKLNQTDYVPLVKIFLGYKESDIKHDMDGFGALNPPRENQFTMGSVWNTSLFPHVSPQGEFLLTAIAGGAHNRTILEQSNESLLNRVKADISRYFGISASPVFERIWRMPAAIPQYNAALKELKKEILQLESDNIYVNAAWLGGPALSDCIKKSKKNAVKITEAMSGVAEYKGCC